MQQHYLDYALEQLIQILKIPSPTGFTDNVSTYIFDELTRLGYSPEKTVKGGVFTELGGSGKGLLMTAHVDTLGGIVCDIKLNGRLKISPLGGLNVQNIEGENVEIHTRSGRVYTGTFQFENASAHVNPEYKTAKRTFDNMEVVIDETSWALDVERGDFVCFEPRPVITASGYIKSRFLDDKLSCAILLAFAKYAKDECLNRKVYLHFTVFEEVGHGGAGSVPVDVSDMLAIDMGCVGEGLTCQETFVSICAKNSHGPSNYSFVTELINAAKKHNLKYALDVYPSYSSDADAGLKAGYDIRHCTIGPGVYASHGYERSHIEGLKNTFDLIVNYCLKNVELL